jgi:diguanylate cyclase (GGDEF)-like protein/PAS domain S-box-containing protein
MEHVHDANLPGPASHLQNAAELDRARHEAELAYHHDTYLLAPTAHFLIGFDTSVLQVNLAGAEMLGISRSHPLSERLRAFVRPPFLPDFDGFISKAINSGIAERCNLELRGKAGQPSLPVTLLATIDPSGQACRVTIELATGKVEALERSEERLRRIVHSAEEGIWEFDASHKTTFVNPKMAQMLGVGIEDMLGKPITNFMDEAGRGILELNLARRRRGIQEKLEFKFIRSNGQELWTSVSVSAMYDADAVYQGALAMVSDMSSRRETAELIWHQANFDALTDLPNRHMFMDRLGLEIKKAQRTGALLALLFIDLDRFKEVNDRFGHAQGDALLVEASRRIKACVRATDTLARLGGDEFTVILAGFEQASSIERIVQEILKQLSTVFVLGEDQAFVSGSVGIAMYPADANTVHDLLSHADKAMYAAKHEGRNRYFYFTPDLQRTAQFRLDMAADLRIAIAKQQFEIYYQPIVSLRSGKIYKAEALLRWNHPERGLLEPAQFLPYAETNGLIVEIGDWVFRHAARQVQKWQRTLHQTFQISVNKSPVQFRRDPESYQAWFDYLSDLKLPPNSLVVEITEGVLVDGGKSVIERLKQYRAMGLQVSLDDFGTGYASLQHLTQFDVDYLKIDQSFVAGLETEAGDLAMCEAIILMAHKLGLRVIAEGVETRMQRALLLEAGCDYAQGYAFAKAMPASEFEKMARTPVPPLSHNGTTDNNEA